MTGPRVVAGLRAFASLAALAAVPAATAACSADRAAEPAPLSLAAFQVTANGPATPECPFVLENQRLSCRRVEVGQRISGEIASVYSYGSPVHVTDGTYCDQDYCVAAEGGTYRFAEGRANATSLVRAERIVVVRDGEEFGFVLVGRGPEPSRPALTLALEWPAFSTRLNDRITETLLEDRQSS